MAQSVTRGWHDLLGRLRGWGREIANTRPVRWLLGSHAVCMRLANGSCVKLHDGRLNPAGSCRFDRARFRGLSVPGSLVLVRDVDVPEGLSTAQVEEMLGLDVLANSPFPDEETLWGYAFSGRERVRLVIASRAHLWGWAREQGVGAIDKCELWVDRDPWIRFRGEGDSARMASQRRWQRANLIALVLLVVLFWAAALTPLYHKWSELKQYQAESATLSARADEYLRSREQLVETIERVDRAKRWLGQQAEADWLLYRLTGLLPDHAMVERMELSGERVRLQGQSENAGSLPEVLAQEALFRGIRMPRAISRDPRTDRERYLVEFEMVWEETQ